ncbi:hypothetical protein EVAR_64397_1 [Eumeta japonica]|uniref:Endonuclease/exonuclease/phosphatase domain-containing protein n=1 Tax=Eumeta variegata TaxID=151549 RepID=A0A4C1SJ24_EUMVA|nr:hypothetical protein EVAR_64397_1 [Eumeta japonica]
MAATGCLLQLQTATVSVYLPSPKKLLWRDLRVFLALGDAVILFGDFNCKSPGRRCPNTNHNGDKLTQYEERLEFEIIVLSTSTYYPDIAINRSSTLDIAPTKEAALNLNCIETLSLSSF